MMPNRLLGHLTATALGGLLAAGLLTACNSDKLLKVQSPSRIPAAGLESPENAVLLSNSAIADFECAYGAYVVATGLIAGELQDATQTADRYPYAQRTVNSASTRYQNSGCEGLGVYSPLQTARISNDNVRKLLSTWTDAQVPNRQQLLATAAAFEGYTDLLLGEGFCGTVFSTVNPDKSINFGTAITPQQAFDSAITRFTEAITAAQAVGAGASNITNMALVGRARAKLDKGDLAGARADAVQVPAGFVYNMTAAATPGRRYNRVWADNGVAGGGSFNLGSTVAPAYLGLADPRIPVQNVGRNSVTGLPLWVQTKYATAASPLPIASGAEAQLIVAEADLASNPSNALNIVNAFRAAGNESALPAGTTGSDLKNALIEERRRALYLQGTRLFDVIRLNQPLTPPAGATFYGGGTYGNQLCLPLPDVEKNNNPLLRGT